MPFCSGRMAFPITAYTQQGRLDAVAAWVDIDMFLWPSSPCCPPCRVQLRRITRAMQHQLGAPPPFPSVSTEGKKLN